MGILEQKKIVLLNYSLVLSLLKYRNVWVFWNKKKAGSNRCSPLNSSIDNLILKGHDVAIKFVTSSQTRMLLMLAKKNVSTLFYIYIYIYIYIKVPK